MRVEVAIARESPDHVWKTVEAGDPYEVQLLVNDLKFAGHEKFREGCHFTPQGLNRFRIDSPDESEKGLADAANRRKALLEKQALEAEIALDEKALVSQKLAELEDSWALENDGVIRRSEGERSLFVPNSSEKPPAWIPEEVYEEFLAEYPDWEFTHSPDIDDGNSDEDDSGDDD